MAGREGDSLERSSLHKAAGLTDGFGKVHHRPYLQEEEEVGKEDEEDERCSISVTSHGSFGRGMGGLSWAGE